MPRFIIDANLPFRFSVWNTEDFLHVFQINESFTDEQIWEYARKNTLTIVTKDADFSLKALTKGTPPKVVHIRFGNLKMKDFHDKISKFWPEIELLLQENSIVNIYTDHIETVK